MMAIREMRHAFVPAPIVPEIHELFENHGPMLAGDRRHGAIGSPAAIRSVARRAGLEQRGAMEAIRSQLCCGSEFSESRCGVRVGGVRYRSEKRRQHRSDDDRTVLTHGVAPTSGHSMFAFN